MRSAKRPGTFSSASIEPSALDCPQSESPPVALTRDIQTYDQVVRRGRKGTSTHDWLHDMDITKIKFKNATVGEVRAALRDFLEVGIEMPEFVDGQFVMPPPRRVTSAMQESVNEACPASFALSAQPRQETNFL